MFRQIGNAWNRAIKRIASNVVTFDNNQTIAPFYDHIPAGVELEFSDGSTRRFTWLADKQAWFE